MANESGLLKTCGHAQVAVDSRGGFASVAHGVHYQAGAAHDIATREYAGYAGHLVSTNVGTMRNDSIPKRRAWNLSETCRELTISCQIRGGLNVSSFKIDPLPSAGAALKPPMQVPLLDLKKQYAPLREKIRAKIDEVADSQYFILGPEVEGLEREG